MTTERPVNDPAGVERIFLAVWLDDAAHAALAPLADWIAGLGSHRLVPPGQRHLTVAFLGDLTAAQRQNVVEATMGACARQAPVVAPMSRLIALPTPRSPRVLAVGLAGEPGLSALLVAVARGAVEAAGTPTAQRALARDPAPHVTLARATRSGAPRSVDLRTAPATTGNVVVREIDVVGSRLTNAGPEYQRVSTCPIGGRRPV